VARKVGLGLVAAAMGASAAMAAPKGQGACPFSSKDIDGWYKEMGFDLGADDANAVCATDGATYASMVDQEQAMGQKVIDGATVTGLKMNKQMIVHLLQSGWNGLPAMTYEISFIVNNAAYLPQGAANTAGVVFNTPAVPLGDLDAQACITQIVNSQAYNRWACGKQ
jgi:hypothetical protein